MVEETTEEERLNFARSYGVEPVVPKDVSFKEAATFVAEMTPIVGDAMAAKEIYDELMKEEPNYPLIAALGGTAVIGAIPGIGDVAAAGLRKVAETYKRLEVDPDAVGMLGGNIRLKPKDQVNFDAEMAALDKAEDATTWQKNAKKAVKKRGIDLDDKKSPEALELQESTRLLLENKITREQHLKTVDRVKPVGEYDQLPREPSDKALVFALDSGKREKGVFVLDDETASKLGANTSSLKVGDQFNSRLDIPAYLAHDTWIVAGTSPAVKTADGKGVTTYAKAVHFGGDDKPVKFIASQKQSEKIGTGVDNKTGYATVSGTVKDLDANAIRAKAAELLDDPEWTQVGFDPRRQGGFYVRAGENKHVPVREATEVIQIGPLVLAKNAKLDLEYQGYSEGGMALEDQMEMNFGNMNVPDNTVGIDPVSGNEIPLGSTAENVRDDIPSFLSEGEIVIPADVVNYHGVKLFEDLRAQAKRGYAQMNADGRIGGEPVMVMEFDGPDIDIDLTEADLETTESPMVEPEEAFLGKFFAGLKSGGNKKTAQQSVQDRFQAAKDRQSVKNIKAGTNTKPKFKNRAEEFLYNLRNSSNNDDRRTPPTVKRTPPKKSATIDFGFGGNPMERASRKYGSPSQETKNEPMRGSSSPSAGEVTDQYVGGMNLREDDKSFFQKLREGVGYDEGGLTSIEGQTGGFGEEIGTSMGAMTPGGVMEARTYRNDAGHEIVIMFLDGQPITAIPEGYYPVGDSTFVAPDTPQAQQTGGSSDSGGSGSEPPKPQAVDYQALTPDELAEFVENQGSITGNLIAAGLGVLNPVVGLVAKYAMYDQAKKIEAEIERRLADPDLDPLVEAYYQNLLEKAKADKPSLLERLFGNDEEAKAKATADEVTEEKVEEEQTPEDETPDIGGYDEVPLKGYSPEQKADEDGITTQQASEQVKNIIEDATDPEPYVGKTAAQMIQDEIDIKRIEDEMKSQPRPMDDDTFDAMGGYDEPEEEPVSITPTQPTPTQQRERTKDAGRSARKTFEAFKNDPSKSKSIARNAPALQRTESVIRDMERGVQRGFEKGGLVNKPKNTRKKNKKSK